MAETSVKGVTRRLGEYLRLAREAAGLTQQQVAQEISVKLPPKGISQGLLAQYERGIIVLPDATILQKLAEIYRVEYHEMVFRMALDLVDRYTGVIDGPSAEIAQKRASLWEADLTRYPTVGGIQGLEAGVLDSKASFSREFEVLDVKWLAEWQKLIKPLQEFWIITPHFLDDHDPGILDAVLHNLKRKVQYIYFVREADTRRGGRFHVLRSTLARLASDLDKPIDEAEISRLVRSVGIDEDDLKWINTDIVIANPLSSHAVGFASIRQQESPVYGYRLGDKDIATIVAQMADYIRGSADDNVRSIFTPRQKSKTKK